VDRRPRRFERGLDAQESDVSAIEARELSKTYRVPEREPGLAAAFKSMFDRKFRDVRAVDGITFSIAEGELVGFLGPNGAGKTTTLKMLSGLLHPTAGELRVLGSSPALRERGFQRNLALVMGHRTQLWWELPPSDTFRLNKEIYELSDSEFTESMDELTELLDLGDVLSVPTKKLSLGQRMKAELAVSLLHRPKLLLLDEPTLGLDVVMQKALRRFIKSYNTRHKATILLTSHNMDDVSELAERVLIIDKGRILHDGALRDVVRRFAPTKQITALLRGKNEPETYEVPRADVSRRAAELLARPDLEDLSIEELPIDEVIRRVFLERR
jgi:ABC-2 type transport system ATP-binding protein